MSEIRYIISDLDGTLVDTFEANFGAYQEVLQNYGYYLTKAQFRQSFGLRLNDLLVSLGLNFNKEEIQTIRARKAECYPKYFDRLKLNRPLYNYFCAFKRQGGHLALVSTASRRNIENVLAATNSRDVFEFIISGEEVSQGKPSPECFICAQKRWGAPPEEILIYEDSEVGLTAAAQAQIAVIKIGTLFYEN